MSLLAMVRQTDLKILARDLLPRRYQVPTKYWYNWLRGGLEAEMKLVSLIVRKHDRVIDIGGNRGIYAYYSWKLGAKVEVFEPNPICFRILKAWAGSKLDVNVHSVALSNGQGSANLHIPIDESGVEHDASASIENDSFMHARHQLVTLQTLDSYQFQEIQLVKIDVEGHESSVIEGAGATIAESKPALLVEIEQRHNGRPIGDIFEKILCFGYQGFFMERGKLTSLKHFKAEIHQSIENFNNPEHPYINNFLFLHRVRLSNGHYKGLIESQLLE